MMNERKTLAEFRHELNLSLDKHLVVEGYSDSSFYTAWLDAHDSLDGVSVQVVGTIEVKNELVRKLGLPDAERSRVIALSGEVQEFHEKVLCVADRDTGIGVDEFQFKTLAWTDYPAIESYVMHPKLFRIAHRICLQAKIKEATELHEELTSALLKLWRVRVKHPHLEAPNYKKGVKNGAGLGGFDVVAAVGFDDKISGGDMSEESSCDVREISYGHDIAGLLFAAYATQIKTKLQYSGVDSLERSLRASILSTAELASERLFIRLKNWASGAGQIAP